jgi:hypothetical protein
MSKGSSGRGSSSHSGPGGWPSTTGRPSGGGRTNGPRIGSAAAMEVLQAVALAAVEKVNDFS